MSSSNLKRFTIDARQQKQGSHEGHEVLKFLERGRNWKSIGPGNFRISFMTLAIFVWVCSSNRRHATDRWIVDAKPDLIGTIGHEGGEAIHEGFEAPPRGLIDQSSLAVEYL
jgi:hypothetical protein